MCGICGYLSNRPISDAELRGMNDTMYHRGPNDSGIWEEVQETHAVGMAHRRLSIQDLSALGHQPMLSQEKDVILVFNGEIYNYPLLKKELERTGYVFQSHCDTEVVLAAYRQWGCQCFKRLNGMFAIAVYDRNKRQIILARDRIGKKPLYYYHKEGNFVFGSELKPIMKYPRFDKKIQREMIGRFLCNKYIEAPFSIFENTYKMIPGTFLIYQDGNVSINTFWDIIEQKEKLSDLDVTSSFDDSAERLDSIIYEAVKRRLIADVPVGTFLSGGIDSTLITAMAQRAAGSQIKSFSIGFYEKERNEAPYAAEISKYIGTDHTELYVGEDEILAMLKELPYYYDEPFSDSSQLPTMLVSKLASEQVTVALSGDGGDELFCGYKMYDWTRIAQKADLLGKIVYYLPGMGQVKKSLPPELRAFINNRNENYKTQLFVEVMEEEASLLLGMPFIEAKFSCEKKLHYDNWQERRMLLDMMTYLPDEILAKTDRASMKYSLEVRCPILDYEVIEQSFAIPHKFKYNKGDKKHILKEVTYRYVPGQLLDRPKKGFGVPLKRWLETVLADEIKKYSDKDILKRQGIFVPEAVERLRLLQNKSDRIMYSSMLWSFYVFQMWYQMYIEDLWE